MPQVYSTKWDGIALYYCWYRLIIHMQSHMEQLYITEVTSETPKQKPSPLEDGGVVADLDAFLSRCQYVGAEARWP